MELNGLPLHPLAVHGAVVLAPLAGLTALAYLVPAWRDRLRWPLLVLALVAVGTVVLAFFSGRDLLESRFARVTGPLEQQLETHEDRGTVLLWVTLGWSSLVVLTTALHDRSGPLRWVLGGLVAVGALAVLVLVVLTGDSGSRAVWGTGG